MSGPSLSRLLPDAAATDALGSRLSAVVGPGDVLLLHGPVGAGKTALARALITALRRRADLDAEDVPSPTFTLVQTYDAGTFEVWHADLYRLSGPDGVTELGLDEAFGTALCLVEWPDRLGAARPANAVDVTLDYAEKDGRRLTLTGPVETLDRLHAAIVED